MCDHKQRAEQTTHQIKTLRHPEGFSITNNVPPRAQRRSSADFAPPSPSRKAEFHIFWLPVSWNLVNGDIFRQGIKNGRLVGSRPESDALERLRNLVGKLIS